MRSRAKSQMTTHQTLAHDYSHHAEHETAIALDHHFNFTSMEGVRIEFRTEPETTMEDYKMIRDLHKWTSGTLSSDLLYSFYLDKN